MVVFKEASASLDDYLDGRFQAIGSSTNAIKQNFGRAPMVSFDRAVITCRSNLSNTDSIQVTRFP